MAARGLARVRAIPLRSTRVACRSYRAHPSAFNHCVDLVKQHDPERYICNLHAPKSARSGLFALHAFNLETSRIKSSTTDKNIGRMRLLWWRQALAQTAEGSPPDQPVLHALAHSGAQYRWTWRYLEQLLDAREADLELTQPSSQAELLSYCERTAGSLSLLACECANSKEATSFNVEVAEQAALHVGAALGIATLLRGLPLHCAQGCSYIPEDVAARHGLTLKEALSGSATPALTDAVNELGHEATKHLLAARSFCPDLSPGARAALLPATISDMILQRLERHFYSPFAPEVGQPLGVRLQLAVGLNWCRGIY